MTEIIKHEAKVIFKNSYWVLGFFFIFGILPYMNYYHWDGVYYNRVLTFGEGINTMALVTDKDSYCPGDSVFTETNFCKNRDVSKFETQWWLGNGRLIAVRDDSSEDEGVAELPVGCYPSNSDAVTLSKRFQIPLDTEPGFHYGYGLTKHFLDLNRKPRLQTYQTVPFYVKPADQCGNI